MSDAVFVSGLALHAYHGVMQHEAKIGQTFRLDLVLDIDLSEASRSDKLAHTVGYDQVVEVASRAFCARRYKLVETAAGAVAGALLERFRQVRRPSADLVNQRSPTSWRNIVSSPVVSFASRRHAARRAAEISSMSSLVSAGTRIAMPLSYRRW